MDLREITIYLDKYLEVTSFTDESCNGLQVENSGVVNKIALAVDACLEAILKCAEAACTMLIVHHGLFWGEGSYPNPFASL
jgi:putative NIF3 family GTP cyclohydrolase 1 type 2